MNKQPCPSLPHTTQPAPNLFLVDLTDLLLPHPGHQVDVAASSHFCGAGFWGYWRGVWSPKSCFPCFSFKNSSSLLRRVYIKFPKHWATRSLMGLLPLPLCSEPVSQEGHENLTLPCPGVNSELRIAAFTSSPCITSSPSVWGWDSVLMCLLSKGSWHSRGTHANILIAFYTLQKILVKGGLTQKDVLS